MRVLEKTGVSPAAPAGSVVVHSSSLPLTFFDIVWLRASPVERLFFFHFPHSTPHFIESHLPNLKSSLSLTLHHFYPLAGKVRLSPNSADRFELHYVAGDSVLFTVAESDLDFQELVGDHAREVATFQCLVPHLPEAVDDIRGLLAIQVTLFPNHGISIGFTVHHVACDGFSSMHFIKSWASSCMSGEKVSLSGPPPSFDRSAIVDPCDLYSEKFAVVPAFTNSLPPSDLVAVTFNLGPNHIQGIKNLVSSKKNGSTFISSCAYVWVCTVKSRGYPSERKANLLFLADWRSRLQPLPPATYFGNCIGVCIAEANICDLTKEDGIVVAAEAIASAIEGLKEGFLKNMKGPKGKYIDVILTVADSPKFKVYDTDFGWGRPAKVEMLSIWKSGLCGTMSLVESREEPGGVEIGFGLPKTQMDALVAQFDHNLKTLFG